MGTYVAVRVSTGVHAPRTTAMRARIINRAPISESLWVRITRWTGCRPMRDGIETERPLARETTRSERQLRSRVTWRVGSARARVEPAVRGDGSAVAERASFERARTPGRGRTRERDLERDPCTCRVAQASPSSRCRIKEFARFARRL